MLISKFRAGLDILAQYFDGDCHGIGAEHDEFFVYATSRPVSLFDLEKLVELGWRQPEADYDGEEGFKAENYDPDESWAVFV